MAYGFRVIGDSGSVQIDAEFASLAVRYKYTLTDGGGPYNWQYVTVACETPVVACRCVGGRGGMTAYASNGDGTWSFSFSVESGATLTVYIFDRPQPVSAPPNYGLIVRDALGRTTFDSRCNYLRPVGIVSSADIDTDAAWSSTGSGNYVYRYRDFTYSPGRIYAAIPSQYASRYKLVYARGPGGGYDGYLRRWAIFDLLGTDIPGGIRLIENDTQQIEEEADIPPTFTGPTRRAARAVIVDVTNY